MSDISTETPPSPRQEQPFGPQGQAPAVEMDNVSKDYDGGMIKALNGLSLRIEQGESVAVTGPSGGERQRVAIARALANEPGLLLADEPTGSLDERSVDLVLDLFSRLRAERPGMTMIIVTHDIRVADTADRIIWLRDGRVDHAHGAIGSSLSRNAGVRRGYARRPR